MLEINWEKLKTLADKLAQSEGGPAQMQSEEYMLLKNYVNSLKDAQDWEGILRVRELFEHIFAQDTMSINDVFMEINKLAIQACETLRKDEQLAQFLSTSGQALHRMGMHKEAIEVFNRSYDLYMRAGKNFKANESLHMTALCLRPLGQTNKAREVLQKVMNSFEDDEPWLGHPLRTLAWLERDEKRFEEAENLIRKGLDNFIKSNAPENIIAEQLSDLAEIVGLQKRYKEAKDIFEESLSIFNRVGSKVVRQVARAQMKYAELELRMGNLSEALELLDKADTALRSLGPYYDQIWKIEMMCVNVHLRMGNWQLALRKFGSVVSIFGKTEMKPRDLIRQVVNRVKIGSGI